MGSICVASRMLEKPCSIVSVFLQDLHIFFCFEGMGCLRSSSLSWRRLKEALITSLAVIRVSAFSDCRTTASSLRNGLRPQRLCSSLETSVRLFSFLGLFPEAPGDRCLPVGLCGLTF